MFMHKFIIVSWCVKGTFSKDKVVLGAWWYISVYINVKIGELLMVNPQSALSSPLEAADALNSPALQ